MCTAMAMSAMTPNPVNAPAPLDVPLTQQTAPVLEFRCLYTSDIRKKVKKWQDGRLKYHTFNKKIMVWDERSHFIGETYWRDDAEFGDGEELRLERNGTLVEVGECIGKHETDLTDLVGKRVKEREERAAAKMTIGSPMRYPAASFGMPETPNAQAYLRPKPLNAVLTPTGHYGRAHVPDTSPFEDRQKAMNGSQRGGENERPAKRRRHESPPSKTGYAHNLLGTKIDLTSSRPSSTAPIRYEPVKVRPIYKAPATTIDLTADEDISDKRSVKEVCEDEMATRERPIITQTRHRERSKPKEGYASQLTGVALNLSGPMELSRLDPKNRYMKHANQTPRVAPVTSPRNLPSADKLYNTELLRERPAAVMEKTKQSQKFSDEVVQPQAKETSEQSFSSAAPSEADQAPGKRPKLGSAGTDAPSGRHGSSLRIKSRPPRRMMMLMEPSHSRPPAAIGEPLTNRSVSKPNSLSCDQPLPSQATKQHNEFCEKREAALQARLKSKRSPVRSVPSSCPDTDGGIDHQTIDFILTSNRGLQDSDGSSAAKALANTPDLLQEVQLSKSSRPSSGRSPDAGNDGGTGQVSIFQPEHSSPQVAATSQVISTAIADGSPPSSDNSRQWDHSSKESSSPICQANEVQSRAAELAQEQKINLRGVGKRILTNASDKMQPLNRTTVPVDTVDEVAPQKGDSTVQLRVVPRPSCQTGPLGADLSSHVGDFSKTDRKSQDSRNTHFAATDRFRAIIKASVSPQNAGENVALVAPARQDQLNNLSTQTSQIAKPTLKAARVKRSPRPSPTILRASMHSPDMFEVMGGQLKTSESQDAVLQLPSTSAVTVGKARLANPATRGTSLQAVTANTVEALRNDSTSAMAPPSNVRSRAERPRVIDGGSSMHVTAPVREETAGGPWSRESFDLFGGWRPPIAVAGAASIVAG